VFIYRLRGISTDFSLDLRCENMGGCSVAKIQPGENLRKIIAENGENEQSKQTMFAYSVANKNDSRYYDVNNYDIQSFEVFSEHKCTGKKWNKGRVQNLKETVLSSSVAHA
jgi:hypothetical protein